MGGSKSGLAHLIRRCGGRPSSCPSMTPGISPVHQKGPGDSSGAGPSHCGSGVCARLQAASPRHPAYRPHAAEVPVAVHVKEQTQPSTLRKPLHDGVMPLDRKVTEVQLSQDEHGAPQPRASSLAPFTCAVNDPAGLIVELSILLRGRNEAQLIASGLIRGEEQVEVIQID
jgi:hypothetical protein